MKWKLDFECIGELQILEIILESFLDCKVCEDEVVNKVVKRLLHKIKHRKYN